MKSFLSSLLLALSFIIMPFSAANAQSNQASEASTQQKECIGRPAYSVGDMWVYENRAGKQWQYRIVKTDAQGRFVDNWNGTLTSDLNHVNRWAGRFGELRFEYDSMYYNYPICPGSSWSKTTAWSASDGKRGSTVTEGYISGWENISIRSIDGTPHTVRALRIERKIRHSYSMSSPEKFTCWHLPEAGIEIRCRGDGYDFDIISYRRNAGADKTLIKF